MTLWRCLELYTISPNLRRVRPPPIITKTMRRKIIQIQTLDRGVIVGLCDDGTVWQYAADAKWTQCTDLPQPGGVKINPAPETMCEWVRKKYLGKVVLGVKDSDGKHVPKNTKLPQKVTSASPGVFQGKDGECWPCVWLTLPNGERLCVYRDEVVVFEEDDEEDFFNLD